MRVCEVEGCEEKHEAKELCKKHYRKQYNDSEHGKLNREKWLEKNKGIYKDVYSPRYKEKQSIYAKTEKGKKVRAEYKKSSVGKIAVKRYNESEKGRKGQRENSERMRKLYPEKVIARRLANKYIEEIECSIIGCNRLGERHHPDYSKPLDVTSLCTEHHREVVNA